MYFPDNVAGLTALSERVHGFVLRWRTAIGRKLRRPVEHSPRPRRNGGVSALCERGKSADRGVPRWNPWGGDQNGKGLRRGNCVQHHQDDCEPGLLLGDRAGAARRLVPLSFPAAAGQLTRATGEVSQGRY
jgi:hypothetical protein